MVLRSLLPQIGSRVLVASPRWLSSTATSHHEGVSSCKVDNDELSLKDLDTKWAERWSQSPQKQRKVSRNKHSKYILSQFPYPSGRLHMGHLRVYTINDALSRFYRAKGFDVIHPMGWDAFGLPAENAAIEHKISPSVWTKDNISKMKRQIKKMLSSFDWDREIATCNPDYYRWTQKIFLLLYEEGLAYRKEAEINWDPVDETVLANEQVDSQGKSWRSGALVEKRFLKQWFLGITEFAEDLNSDLDLLSDWPEKVKAMQRNWIGKSEGVEIELLSNCPDVTIKVFTTRPETTFVIQYVALSINNPIAKKIAESDVNLRLFIERAQNLPADSKEGYEISSIKLSNPFKTEKFDIPVYVAPYVIDSYGTGAVMGCPGHDERDHDFWTQNKPGAHIMKCIEPVNGDNNTDGPLTGKDGIMNDVAGPLAGLTTKQAIKQAIPLLENTGLAKAKTNYRLRDWLISRQRFWGTPIPIIYCDTCGTVPVPDEQLPVLLPEKTEFIGKGNPLSSIEEFVNVCCPKCGSAAKRETDTMDTFIDSSWYFFRYIDPKNNLKPFSPEKVNASMPVDIYIGGIEHAILHLLYSRFISKFLAKKGLWDGSFCYGEPFKKLVTQGMVHAETFTDPQNGRYLKPHEIDLSNRLKPRIAGTEIVPTVTHEKMSKSKYNGTDPTECITNHGADATRAHILFQAPISDVLNWSESKIVGVERWLRRLINVGKSIKHNTENVPAISKPLLLNQREIDFQRKCQQLLSSINIAFEKTLSLNTVISDYMKWTQEINAALENKDVRLPIIISSYKKLIVAVAPVAPATSEECWEGINETLSTEWESVHEQSWPTIDKIKEQQVVKYKFFVNGKMRFTFEGDKDLWKHDPKALLTLAQRNERYHKFVGERKVTRFITKAGTVILTVQEE